MVRLLKRLVNLPKKDFKAFMKRYWISYANIIFYLTVAVGTYGDFVNFLALQVVVVMLLLFFTTHYGALTFKENTLNDEIYELHEKISTLMCTKHTLELEVERLQTYEKNFYAAKQAYIDNICDKNGNDQD